jgi:hypothetical protein
LELDIMVRYLAGEATTAERFAVECHLGECPDCVRRLRALEVLGRDFDGVWGTWSAGEHARLARAGRGVGDPGVPIEGIAGAKVPAGSAVGRVAAPPSGSAARGSPPGEGSNWFAEVAAWWAWVFAVPSRRLAWVGVGVALVIVGAYLGVWPLVRPAATVLLADTGGVVMVGRDGRVRLPGDRMLAPEWQTRLDRLARGEAAEVAGGVGPRLAALRQEEARLGGSSRSNALPLAPVGVLVPLNRVEFRWQGVAGATNYSLLITEGSRVVFEALTGGRTNLVLAPPELSLQPGTDYAWLVEAWVAGQPRGFAPVKFGTPAAEAWGEIARLEAEQGASALLMAQVYWHYGLLAEAADRLRELEQRNPDHAWLASLKGRLAQTSSP